MNTRITGAILLACMLLSPPALPQENEAPETPGEAAQLTLNDLRTFTDVFNQVRRNYVEEIDDKTLLEAAIRGMLTDLDPHSAYLPQTDFEDLNDSSRGRYSGIGVDVRAMDQRIVVNAVIDDSPADRAGINPGDTIISIDDRPVKGRFLPDAMDELGGEPDTTVRLTVLEPGGEQREVELTRRYIKLPTLVFEMLPNHYGYFGISSFHKQSSIDLKNTLDSVQADGSKLAGVIIDLRNNTGGILQQAIAMADGFLDSGVIVSTRGRNATMQMEFEARPGEWLPGVPIILLVDRGSASASEVLAGALQDNGRALLIGERTFGKGSVQSVLPLRNGDGIKLTTALYYTPSGRSIQAEGISPDIWIVDDEAPEAVDIRHRESDLEGHLPADSVADTSRKALPETLPDDFSVDELLGVLKEAGILSGTRTAAEGADKEESS